MGRGLTVALLWIVTAAPTAASAQSAASPSDWARVDSLRPGTKIVVTLKTSGERIGRFNRSTGTDLTLETRRATDQHPAQELTLAKSEILTVVTYDPLADGIQWGALGGAAAATGLMVASLHKCGGACENDMPANAPLMAALVGGGAGAAIGYVFDRATDHSKIVYPAPLTRARRETSTRVAVGVAPALRMTPGVAVAVQISWVHTEIGDVAGHW